MSTEEEKTSPSPTEEKKAPENTVITLPCEFPYRLIGNALILGVIFFLASVTLTLKNDLINKQLIGFQNSLYELSSRLGFTIDDIIIRGRHHTTVEEINNAINLTREDNILKANLNDIRYQIEQLPWVKNAAVKKSFFPNIIQIDIDEHEVKSLWQYNERFHPIDEDGNVIEADYIPPKEILLIVGAGAPENINTLLNIINNDSEIFKRVKAANYISERRWNIILDDIEHGITIMLPEKDVEQAWKKLIKINTEKNILKRKLTKIDLRLPKKVTVTIEKTSKARKKAAAKERKL